MAASPLTAALQNSSSDTGSVISQMKQDASFAFASLTHAS